MPTDTTPIVRLINCGDCGAPMRYREAAGGRQALYACEEEHRTGRSVRLQAHATDYLVIGGVLNAIFRGRSFATVQSAVSEYEANEGVRGRPGEDIASLRDEISLFLRTEDRVDVAAHFLTRFIRDVKLFPDRAVVHYALPLPADSRLAGATEQEIPLLPLPSPHSAGPGSAPAG